MVNALTERLSPFFTGDYYETLRVTRAATAAEIKSAYRRLARMYHPDRNPGNRFCEEIFKRISAAYSCLSDPAKRTNYDLGGDEGDSIIERLRRRRYPAWLIRMTKEEGVFIRDAQRMADERGFIL